MKKIISSDSCGKKSKLQIASCIKILKLLWSLLWFPGTVCKTYLFYSRNCTIKLQNVSNNLFFTVMINLQIKQIHNWKLKYKKKFNNSIYEKKKKKFRNIKKPYSLVTKYILNNLLTNNLWQFSSWLGLKREYMYWGVVQIILL